jgi:hypothetical protein
MTGLRVSFILTLVVPVFILGTSFGFMIGRVNPLLTSSPVTPPVQSEPLAVPEATSDEQVADTLPADTEMEWQVYENSELGYSFSYPVNWSLDYEYNDGIESEQRDFGGGIFSPDYIKCEGVRCGYIDTIQGSGVHIGSRSISKSGGTHNSVQSILDGTYESKMSYDQQRNISAGPLTGVEYVAGYEGPPMLISQFDVGDTSYTISLESAVHPEKDGFYNANTEIYRKIVSSFRLTQ